MLKSKKPPHDSARLVHTALPKRSLKTSGKLTSMRIDFAMERLHQSGQMTGGKTKAISARIDPGILQAAKKQSGITSDSELVNAALAVIAAGDNFGVFLLSQAGKLSEDFEIAV